MHHVNYDYTAGLDAKPKKRKQRAQLSCNDCRRRKLKCDRQIPCNRCINGGIAHTCAYGQGESASTLTDAPTRSPKRHRQSDSQLSNVSKSSAVEVISECAEKSTASAFPVNDRVKQLENRVASLEALLSVLQNQHSSVEPHDQSNLSSCSSAPLTGLFKGRDYRTFFYGTTSPMATVAHFPAVRCFMKKIYANSTLERLRQDIKTLEKRTKTNPASRQALHVPNLRSLLPDRITTDAVVNTYFDTFETTFRIIHRPSFWKAYQSYWDEAHSPTCEMDAIVLSILAATLCISTHATPRYDSNGSTFRSKATTWIKACEAWLRQQSNKYRTLACLQVRCLRLLALSTTCLKTKEYYQEVQAHMAFMRSSGFHRDPAALGGRCSVFEAEIRRRLWATSMELELQASIDKGAPSALSGFEFDCSPPRNFDDSELNESMHELPPSKNSSEFTDTSYLCISMYSIRLRIDLCAVSNSLKTSPDFEATLRYEKEVRTHIKRIPQWTDSRSLQAWTLLDLQLTQFLVILHAPGALDTQLLSDPNHRYSTITCLESSSFLVERHFKLIGLGNFALCCARSDYSRAAMLICLIAHASCTAADTLIKPLAKSIFDETIEKALCLQEERAMRPGRGGHQHWYLSAACSLVGVTFDPTRTEILKRQAVDRVSKLFYKTLSLQDDPSDESLAREVILGSNSTNTYGNNIGVNVMPDTVPPDPLPDTGLRLDGVDTLDFGNMSEWMFDDFWFFNGAPNLGLNG